MGKKITALGIDLGTTYSCVAYVDEFGVPQVIRNSKDENTIPSFVCFANQPPLVGSEAKHMQLACPENTVREIKRHMVRPESFKKPTSFPNNLDPAEISAVILKKLVADANAALGRENDPIKDVVITVPADFGDLGHRNTEAAGKIADLNVLRIINEPTAAAIAYGLDRGGNQTVLVYDLGGGTFDVTILNISNGKFKVIKTKGDPHLGGSDWDKRLAGMILGEYNRRYGSNFVLPMTEDMLREAPVEDKQMFYSLMAEAENVKKTLSKLSAAQTNWLFERDGRSLSPAFRITREAFEAETSDLLARTLEKVREILEETKDLTIDTVVMVGGSTLMPQVQKALEKEFSCPVTSFDAGFAVAKGAAIQAHLLAGGSIRDKVLAEDEDDKEAVEDAGDKIVITDVCSKTYGIGVRDNEVFNLIYANTPLPVSKSAPFSTYNENQTGIFLQVYESDSMKEIISRDEAVLVGEGASILFGKEVPSGYPVQECLSIDTNGIVTVSAWSEEGASVEFKVQIKGVKDADDLAESRDTIDKICLDM